jgi:S1-C subfamily serine protease
VDAPVGLVQSLLPVTAHVAARVAAAHPSARLLGTERMGSAVVVDPAGLLLTVNYVVMGARRIRVSLTDGRRLDARIVAQDFDSGLALLRVAAGGLPAAPLGSSEDLAPGAPVLSSPRRARPTGASRGGS